MAKFVEVEAHARARASQPTLYAIAADSAGYPQWSMIGAFEAVRDGEGGPFGVGSRRIYSTFPLKLLEEVVELVPPRRVGYILISGLPFRGYRADIDLTATEDGATDIRWRASFEPTIAGTSWFFRAMMQAVLARMAGELAREAERRERMAR
jgi:hypothetical protein